MSALRSFVTCVEASRRDLTETVVPLRRSLPPRRVYGGGTRMLPVFLDGADNICPCCHSRAWHVGRITAECAVCQAALPLLRAMPTTRVVAR